MKERLTGAIILVVLIVLLVPELLSGPKGASAPAPTASAPNSSEEPPLRSYTINLGDDSHPRTEGAGGNGPAMPQPSGPEQPTAQPSGAAGDGQASGGAASPSSPKPDAPSVQRVEPSTPTPARGAPAHTQAPTPAQPSPRAANVTQPAPKPSAPTPKPAPQTPTSAATAQKPVTPKPAASATAKPPKGHPAASPSVAANTAASSESGWAVQLGVFASRENAERLALDVRVKGFKASVSPVTSGSRKLYRVRVGPAPDRSAAQELQGRLKAAGRPGGTVVPYS